MKMQVGFSLIELMVVIAIVAVLSAVAIPAYKEYTVRAKIIDRINIVTAFKDEIVRKHQITGTWPTSVSFGGANVVATVGTLTPALPGISWIYYNVWNNDPNGRLRVMAGFSGLDGIPGFTNAVGVAEPSYGTFRMGVFLSADGTTLNVRCGVYDADWVTGGTNTVDIPLKYLPAACQCNNIQNIVSSTAYPPASPFSGGNVSGCI